MDNLLWRAHLARINKIWSFFIITTAYNLMENHTHASTHAHKWRQTYTQISILRHRRTDRHARTHTYKTTITILAIKNKNQNIIRALSLVHQSSNVHRHLSCLFCSDKYLLLLKSYVLRCWDRRVCPLLFLCVDAEDRIAHGSAEGPER